MSKNICHYLLIGLYSFVLFLCISLARLEFQNTGIDRSKLSSRHLQVHKEFIEKELQKDRRYDLEKLKFLERLEDEKRNIISDVSETKILEEVELSLRSHTRLEEVEKLEKLAKEELSITLNQYLIPKIKTHCIY